MSHFVKRDVCDLKKKKSWFILLTTYFLGEYGILPFCITKCPCKNKVTTSFFDRHFETLAFRSWPVAFALTLNNKRLRDTEQDKQKLS